MVQMLTLCLTGFANLDPNQGIYICIPVAGIYFLNNVIAEWKMVWIGIRWQHKPADLGPLNSQNIMYYKKKFQYDNKI